MTRHYNRRTWGHAQEHAQDTRTYTTAAAQFGQYDDPSSDEEEDTKTEFVDETQMEFEDTTVADVRRFLYGDEAAVSLSDEDSSSELASSTSLSEPEHSTSTPGSGPSVVVTAEKDKEYPALEKKYKAFAEQVIDGDIVKDFPKLDSKTLALRKFQKYPAQKSRIAVVAVVPYLPWRKRDQAGDRARLCGVLMGEHFLKNGWSVWFMQNPAKTELHSALREALKQLGGGGDIALYCCGHGVMEEGLRRFYTCDNKTSKGTLKSYNLYALEDHHYDSNSEQRRHGRGGTLVIAETCATPEGGMKNLADALRLDAYRDFDNNVPWKKRKNRDDKKLSSKGKDAKAKRHKSHSPYYAALFSASPGQTSYTGGIKDPNAAVGDIVAYRFTASLARHMCTTKKFFQVVANVREDMKKDIRLFVDPSGGSGGYYQYTRESWQLVDASAGNKPHNKEELLAKFNKTFHFKKKSSCSVM